VTEDAATVGLCGDYSLAMARHRSMAGATGASEHLRREGAPHRLPERLLRDFEDTLGGPMALYVLDVDGSCLHLLAGDPSRVPLLIPAPIGIGPEVPPEAFEALAEAIARALPRSGSAPLVLADRALGALVRVNGPSSRLDEFASEAALALETISGYTDVVQAAQRHKHPRTAAEMQQNLLPPRIARVTGADIVGGVLPGYDVGGDFFDYADNHEGLWLTVADAVGKENEAAALAAVTIGALRASRRSGGGLEETVGAMRDAVRGCGNTRLVFVTAVVALWNPATHRLRWITAGHPRPIVARSGGDLETLSAGVMRPFGIEGGDGELRAAECSLSAGDRLVLYSDGLIEQPHRRTAERVGIEAIHRVVRESTGVSCAQMVRRLQDLVVEASGGKLRDDATLLALAVDGASEPSQGG
jgi:serine phosphatase RsbU (regulator of sigma subunit)